MSLLKRTGAAIVSVATIVGVTFSVLEYFDDIEGSPSVIQSGFGVRSAHGDTLDSVEVESTETENCVVLEGSVSLKGDSRIPVPTGYTFKVVAGDTSFERSGSGSTYEVSLSSRCIDKDVWIELIHPEYVQIGGPVHLEPSGCNRYTNNFMLQAKTSLPKARYARGLLDEAATFESAGRPDLAIKRYMESWQMNPRPRTCIAWAQVLKKLVMRNIDVSAELEGNLPQITSSALFSRTSNEFKSNFYGQLGDAVDRSELAAFADRQTLSLRYSEYALNAFDSAIHYYSADANPWQGKYLLQMRLGEYQAAHETITLFFEDRSRASTDWDVTGFLTDWATCIETWTGYPTGDSSAYARRVAANEAYCRAWRCLKGELESHQHLFTDTPISSEREKSIRLRSTLKLAKSLPI